MPQFLVVKFDIRNVAERQWQALKAKLGGDAALLFPTPFLHVFRVLLHIDRQVCKIIFLHQEAGLPLGPAQLRDQRGTPTDAGRRIREKDLPDREVGRQAG